MTGTKARSSTALRIVHGATVANATATNTAGGPAERHDRRGAAQTASTSGTSRISPFARVSTASPASRPASRANA